MAIQNNDFIKDLVTYGAGQKKRYKYCFIKQKCQLQMVIAQYRNAAKPLITKGINTTHQHFQIRYVTLF